MGGRAVWWCESGELSAVREFFYKATSISTNNDVLYGCRKTLEEIAVYQIQKN